MSLIVLIVEDEEDLLYLVTEALMDQGTSAIGFSGPDALLENVGLIMEADVLLTDLNMPGRISGAKLCQIVREHNPSIRTVVLTAFATMSEAAYIEELPYVDKVLLKPVTRDELYEVVRPS